MEYPLYQYEPLEQPDSVRVVVLKPCQAFSSILECEIIQYSRQEYLSGWDATKLYEAVSCTWGEPIFNCNLFCGNGDSRSQIKITTTVDAMLRQFRDGFVSRYFWIDAIWLQQADKAEIAAQVPLMGTIYEQAKAVHIWLGPDLQENRASRIFVFIQSLGTLDDTSDQFMQRFTKLSERLLDPLPHRKLDQFWSLPWFGRR